jgi:hypothetical protein
VTITDLEPPARYVRLSKGAVVKHGGLAGTDTIHAMVPDEWTGSSCAACFGWADDPRHLVTLKVRFR